MWCGLRYGMDMMMSQRLLRNVSTGKMMHTKDKMMKTSALQCPLGLPWCAQLPHVADPELCLFIMNL